MPDVFYFAWVDPETPFNALTHAVNDEQVISFDLVQKENDFATLRATIVNPYVGLLSPGRKQWAWISYRSIFDPSADPEPMGLFRLNGIPDDLQDVVLSLEFYARPVGVEAAKAALAGTLREEFWDPIFIDEDERENPDSALEARTQLWDFDRVDHVTRVTDIADGEDGTITIGPDLTIDLRARPNDSPAESCTINAEVFWTQKGQGVVDLSAAIVNASRAAGSTEGNLIATYTGQGLASDWPNKGTSIGGHWSVGESTIFPVDGTIVPRVMTETTVAGDGLPQDEEEAAQITVVVVGFRQWRFSQTFEVIYDTERQYVEKLTFTLNAGVQPISTDPGDGANVTINVGSGDVAAMIDPIDTDFAMPLGDIRRRAYFTQDRGKQTVEWLIALARSTLIKRARIAEITIEVPFWEALQFNCRQNITINDDRLPGGTATGKIVAYEFGLRDDRTWYGRVTIACLVGLGDAISASAGDPVYVEDGYVEAGYQQYEGATSPVAGSVTYGDYFVEPQDDGVNLFQMTPSSVVLSLDYVNGVTAQRAVINGNYQTPQEVVDALNAVFTEIQLVLRPLNTGPFETSYTVPVSDLVIARQIDLEST